MFAGSIQLENVFTRASRLNFKDDRGRELGHAYLYILQNDLHEEPFGFLEDLFVEEFARGKGVGVELLRQAIKVARKNKCYKLIASSLGSSGLCSGERKSLEDMCFASHGYEFMIRWNLD